MKSRQSENHGHCKCQTLRSLSAPFLWAYQHEGKGDVISTEKREILKWLVQQGRFSEQRYCGAYENNRQYNPSKIRRKKV